MQLKDPSEKRFTVCGTPNYIAPEVLHEDVGYGKSADVWSIGVILYVLSIGKTPFESVNTETLYQKIKCGLYRFPEDREFSLEFKNLIRAIFEINPEERLGAEDVLQSDYFMKARVPRKIPGSTRQLSPSEMDIQGFFENGVVDMKEIMLELKGVTEPLPGMEAVFITPKKGEGGCLI